MHMPNEFDGRPWPSIKFTPSVGTYVETAVGASIQISYDYQTNVWMVFRGVQIDVPYKTKPSEIEAIVDKYLNAWHQLVATRGHLVAADYSD